jgi:pimeloyl-ACP methyl ester carboxylesterase
MPAGRTIRRVSGRPPSSRLAVGVGGAVVSAALLLAACSSDNSSSPTTTVAAATTTAPATTSTAGAPTTTVAPTTTTTTIAGPATTLAAPAGDALYDPPSPLPVTTPGDIIWARPFNGPTGSQGYVVLYVSTTVDNTPVAVSGVIIVPGAGAPAAPPEGRTVLTWGHGTTGLGESCAPSKQYPSGQIAEELLAQVAVGKGYIYAATDYQGLGTPGEQPYVVGLSEGRNVLDIATAAEHLAGSGATATSKVLIWGHSQGGGAAAFAAELTPTYTPGLNVVGAMVGAPATDLPAIAAANDGGPYFGFAFMAAVGFKAAYPNLSYDAFLNDAGKQAVAGIVTECSDQILKDFAGKHGSDYEIAAPWETPGWKEAFAANEGGQLKTPVPIFIYQGDNDQIVPVAVSATLLQKYCALGVTASRKTYPGTDHTSVIPAALGDILAFANDRLAGTPAPSSCTA